MSPNMVSTPLHVFDLPQVYQKPSASELEVALSMLTVEAPTFNSAGSEAHEQRPVHPQGITRYLTNIIASPLDWFELEDDRDRIWDLASRRLSERSGRTAMGNITRVFNIPRGAGKGDLPIELHEPALTEDNLGFKTWSSSYVLARRLHLYKLPSLDCADNTSVTPSILELGSGTGLLGLAAAAIWSKQVVLTDLPEIVGNLKRNIEANQSLLDENCGGAQSDPLDWSLEPDFRLAEAQTENPARATIILVADPIYSPEHPKMLVNAICARLCRDEYSHVLMAYPIRQAYAEQIVELHKLMAEAGFTMLEECTELSQDDWAEEVTCACSIWRWS